MNFLFACVCTHIVIVTYLYIKWKNFFKKIQNFSKILKIFFRCIVYCTKCTNLGCRGARLRAYHLRIFLKADIALKIAMSAFYYLIFLIQNSEWLLIRAFAFCAVSVTISSSPLVSVSLLAMNQFSVFSKVTFFKAEQP